MIKINEVGTGYAERTKLNASSAALTVAFAVDFETAGERLTARAASRTKYLGILIQEIPDIEGMAWNLLDRMWYLSKNSKTLNIAGNGIYTLTKFNIDQELINSIIYQVLAIVHKEDPISKIYTGGQTGVDQAGVIAALALGIPIEVNMPKYLKRKGIYGNYIISEDSLLEEYRDQVNYLKITEGIK